MGLKHVNYMEQRPLQRRTRPPQEPGPRLLPIALGIAVVGFALGAVGKMLFSHHGPVAKSLAPHVTPAPNDGLAPVRPQTANLPPIPTPRGTWYVSATAQPFRVVLAPVSRPTHRAIIPSPTVAPTAVPTPLPTVIPTPIVTAAPTPVATKAPKRIAKHHIHVVAHVALPVHTAKPTFEPTARPTLVVIPATAAPTPIAVETPRPSASERVVRRYLSSLIRGDENTAYKLLGAAPGDASAHLSEESFINTSAHINSVQASSSGAGATVRAEIETAGGSYFATYHIDQRDGHLIISSHDFIKL